jgi:short-subunit dehydrogenase
VLHFAPRATRTAMNGAGVQALNAELGVAMDDPAGVARELVRFLRHPARERLLGMPEKLFARINQLLPGVVDRALRRQLPTIRRHAPAASKRESA